MVRVYVIAEGQTEIAFVKKLLVETFSNLGIHLYPTLLGKPGHKGGVISYQRAKSDVIRFLKQERNTFCTTMFDYFRLPDDFSGLPITGNYQSVTKVEIIEQAFKKDIAQTLGNTFTPERFIPYIQIHEFESLLFSNPSALAKSIYRDDLASKFKTIRNAFPSPEDINDHPNTAPSKRIINLYNDYNKITDGILAAIEIGLPTMRKECKHFNQWLLKLEALQQISVD